MSLPRNASYMYCSYELERKKDNRSFLDKSHVLHVGTANQAENYSLLGSAISSVDEVKDLGVVIMAEFKSSAQCIASEQKAQISWAI